MLRTLGDLWRGHGGLVHRDIKVYLARLLPHAEQVLTPYIVSVCNLQKPENILVDTMKQIKLIDFGIAKELSSNTTANTTGFVSGTAAHGTRTTAHTTHTPRHLINATTRTR